MGQNQSLLEIEETFNKQRMRFQNLHQMFGVKSKYVFCGQNNLYLLDPKTKKLIPIKFITVFGKAITRSKHTDVLEVIHIDNKKYYHILENFQIQGGCLFEDKKEAIFMIKLRLI